MKLSANPDKMVILQKLSLSIFLVSKLRAVDFMNIKASQPNQSEDELVENSSSRKTRGDRTI